MIVGFKIDDDQCNSASLARQSWYPNGYIGVPSRHSVGAHPRPRLWPLLCINRRTRQSKGPPGGQPSGPRGRAQRVIQDDREVDRVGLDEISQQMCNRDLSQYGNDLVARARVERRRGRFRCYQFGEQAKIIDALGDAMDIRSMVVLCAIHMKRSAAAETGGVAGVARRRKIGPAVILLGHRTELSSAW